MAARRPVVVIPPRPHPVVRAIPPRQRRRIDAATRQAGAAIYAIPPAPDRHDRTIMFGYFQTLPERVQPEAATYITDNPSNFYILPIDVVEFLDRRHLLSPDNRYVDLTAVHDYLQALPPAHVAPLPELFYPNGQRVADRPAFVDNEFRKLLGNLNVGTFYPVINANGVLDIPTADVRDLPVYLLLFILIEMANNYPAGANRGSYVSYSMSDNPAMALRVLLLNNQGNPIQIIQRRGHRMIAVGNLRAVYMNILRQFAALIPGPAAAAQSTANAMANNNLFATWNGSDDSGTRIRLMNLGRYMHFYLKLHFTPVAVQSMGHCWTPQIDQVLKNAAGDAVVTVKNTQDNKCLLYCVVMGLIMKCRPADDGGKRAFGVNPKLLEPYDVYCKGSYLFMDSSPISVLTRKLARYLVIPTYSAGDVNDPMIGLLEDLDKKVRDLTTMQDFKEEFEQIEKTLIPDGSICGIDVYGIDYNVNIHVYPLYISKNRQNVMELLCITPPQCDFSHFALITNMEKLMKGSGGKQFYSCSKCGKCFYHKRLLGEHVCTASSRNSGVDAEQGYHPSKIGFDLHITPEVGCCPKCRLLFATDFEYLYHMEHCFMRGQSGYRHVQLVGYAEDVHPKLEGVKLDEAAEEKHVKQRRVLYADFECSIDAEGVHSFMSYGVYDWQAQRYECGYTPEEFFDFILHSAYDNPEEHVYVYFHNAMGYDANFILRYVLKTPEFKEWGIQVIMKSANRLQKLVFFTKRGETSRAIHICDSFLFLTLSLERIVGSIRKDDLEQNKENFSRFFEVMRQRYPTVEDKDIDHILRKNIFPYRFFDEAGKLDTPIEEFKAIFQPHPDHLKFFGERVTVEQLAAGFNDTETVIERFGCKNARDYHDLYLCCDVMQLADVFDRSMKILWESHHIHLTKYLGMPSASWAAFLRHDPTLSIPLYENTFYAEFFKAMTRGGVTSAAMRYAKADSRHSIIYLDVNGLYPYVMQAYEYPCGGFTFLPCGWTGSACDVRLREKFRMFEGNHRGACFCVDMHIPDSIKDLTDLYPFAPEHRRIFAEYFTDVDKTEMTPFLKRWSEANENEKMSAFEGLVCTLYDKEKYNVHWKLLQFYMDHGVQIRKVWFAVEFQEGSYLQGYIRKNIEIRNGRKDELGKTLYKLLGNSIYGKTFESPFKRNSFEIIRDPIKLQGMISEGNISAMQPIDDLGWIVKMDGDDIVLDKPTYIGACVVEYAKLHMYTLLYDKLMRIFPGTPEDPGCQMVYTDTDSFILRVRHPDHIGSTPKDLFDYIKSEDPDLIGGIGGQVKSETGEDDTIDEIIALRSKVYAYKTIHGHIGKRAKGTTHDAQETQLDWEAYKTALDSLTSVSTRNVQFVRKVFKISSLDVYRQSLSVNDGKRYICEDGIHTHAYGHPSIPRRH